MGRGARWTPHDAGSRLVLDVAAGRPLPPDLRPTDEQLALAARHGLLGLLATSDHPHLAPAALGAYARLAARQQVMERVLRHVLERFAAAGVRATVVKGPALARWAYRDPRHRTFTDLDLLVPASEVAAALDVLRDDEVTVGIPPKTPKADKRHIPLADPSGVRFSLDLHWDLFSYTQLRGCAHGAVEEAWAQAVWQPDHPLGPMWVLPTETLLAFLAAHAVLDHRFRMILFRDLAEAAPRGVEWDRLLELSRRFGLRSTGYAAWRIAAGTVDAAIPEGALARLRPRSLPVSVTDYLLPRTDLVRFDGHRPRPLNLAMVLLHDRPATRLRLVAAAPFSFPEWLRRVEGAPPSSKARRTQARGPGRRVLHLLPLDVARGAQTYAKALRDLLDGDGAEHRTATIFRSEAAALEADVDLGASVAVGRRLGFSPWAALRLWRYLRQWKPDVVVAHGGEALKYAAFVTPRSTRLAYYKIGAAGSKLASPWRRRLYRRLVGRADLVVGVSGEMLVESDVLLSVPPHRTVCIPNGRDPTRFPSADRDGAVAPVVFVLVGRVEEAKRPMLFLELIGDLRKRGLEVRGLVVGDGPLLDQVRARAGEHVEVLGRRDDVPEILALADVLVLVSLHEGMPGVLIEAGMAGLPAISTDVEGARAVIDDGVTGLVVPLHDFEALVAAGERLVGDAELRRRMGHAARERCIEQFTIESSARRWAEELDDLMAGSAR